MMRRVDPEYSLGRDPLTVIDVGGPLYEVTSPKNPDLRISIPFQNGPYKEAGVVNGLFVEDLLAICRDRLRECHEGPSQGEAVQDATGAAIGAIEAAFLALDERAGERIGRLEGTSRA